MMVSCGCGQRLETNWKICPACGENIPQGPICEGCGEQLQLSWKVCPGCGQSTEKPSAVSLDVRDSTVHTVNQNAVTQNVTNINYADPQLSAVPAGHQIFGRQYCNSCGRSLPDDHFLCSQCNKTSCMDCRSSFGPCLLCTPYSVPGSPGVVRANIDRGNATVSWSVPVTDGGKPILGYMVSIPEIPGKHIEIEEGTHATMPGIPEGGPYTFVVTARNEIGVGPKAESLPVQVSVAYCDSCGRVLPDNHFLCSQCNKPSCMDCRSPLGPCLSCNPYKPPGSPGNMKVDLDRNNATVEWSPPTDDGGKPILEYTVGIQELPGKHVSVKEGTSALISELPTGGPYTFTVSATNEIGRGSKSESLPVEVSLTSCDKCEIILDSDPVICPECGGIFGSECIESSALCIVCHKKALPQSPSAVIANLSPENNGDVEVSWQPSENQRGSPVIGYVVRCVEDSSIMVPVDVSSLAQSPERKFPKYCVSCGADNASDLQYCIGCGETNPTLTDTPDETSRYTAIGQTCSFTVSAANNTGESPPSAPSDPVMLFTQKILPLVEVLRPGQICTIAGTGKKGDSGDGGLAINSNLNEPYDVAVDVRGNVYIADSGNNKIRKIAVDTGIIETEVGTGVAGFFGDGEPSQSAQLDQPRGVDFDGLGNLYIADRGNCRVRKVDTQSHVIETIAGDGQSDNDGDGLPGLQASLANPESVSVDQTTGRVYIAGDHGSIGTKTDADKKRVRVLDEVGTIHSFAGSDDGPNPQDGVSATNVTFSTNDDLVIAADGTGNVFIGEQNGNRLYVVSCENGSIRKIAGNGTVSDTKVDKNLQAIETGLSPQGLAFYGAENALFINDGGSVMFGNKRIRRLDVKSGNIKSIAGSGKGFSGDNGPATSAKFDKPRGLAVDNYGNLYVADSGNNRIRVVKAF